MPGTKNLELFYLHRSVANIAALKAIDTTSIVDGEVLNVSTLGVWYFVKASVATPDDVLIVQPTIGGGRWFRMSLLERQLISGSDYRLNPIGSLNDRYNTNTAYQIGNTDVLSIKGTNNTCVGADTDGSITTGQENVFIGKSAGKNTTSGSYNCYLGFESGYTGTTAQFNTAFGYKTLQSVTNASNNCIFGNSAGSTLTSGGYNCLFGASAGVQTTTASNVCAFGYQAARINNANYLVAIGYRAGNGNLTSLGNTYVGKDAGYIATGANNSILGYEAGSALTTGANNTLYGYQTGLTLTTGSGNIHLGYLAGSQSTESNMLYIDNSNTTTPLIKGNFATNLLNFRGIAAYYAHPTYTYGSFELADVKYVDDIHTDSRFPTGFADWTATLNFTDGTRTFEINGNHNIYIKGKKYSKTTTQKIISTASGNHWVYYDSTGVIQETTGFPSLSENVLIGYVYWNNTFGKGLAFNERHSSNRSVDWHTMHHFTIGCLYGDGLAGSFTDTTFSVGSGSIYDEDLRHSIDTKTTCNILYKNGSIDFEWDLAQTSIYKTVAGIIQYNNGNSLANVTANSYVAYWVFATGDVNNPIYSIMGQREDGNLPAARINNVVNNLIFSTFPAIENRLLYRVLYRNVGGVPTYIETEDLRKATQVPGSPYIATSHQALSNLFLATTGVIYGHIDDQAQTIYGNKTFNDILYAKNGDFQFGTLEPAFSAPQIWNKSTNAIARLGSSTLWGDASNIPSLGYLAYGQNFDLDPMDANNQSQFSISSSSGFNFINRKTGSSVTTYSYNIATGQIITKDDSNNVTYLFNRKTALGTFYGIQSYNAHPNFTIDTQIVDKKYVDDRITPTLKAVINFLDFTTSEPPVPTIGDRYINTVTGTSNITLQSVTINYIYEWNGTNWTETIPNAGDRLYVTTLSTWYTYTGSSWEVDTGDLQQQQFYASSKAGDDSKYDGKSLNEPFLTFSKALTVISGLTPSISNQFKVQGIDAGVYSEAITMQPYTELCAESASFSGTITLVDNSVFHCKRTTGVIQKTSGAGIATIIVDELIDNSGLSGVIKCSSGTLNVICGNATYGVNYLIGDVTTGNKVNFTCLGNVVSTSNGLLVQLAGGGTINCFLNGDTNGNTGTIFQTGGSAGYINVYSNYIYANGTGGKVYNITSGGVLNLTANRLTENTASTKSGSTVNLNILLDNDSKTRIYNDVSNKGVDVQNINFYNDRITPAGSYLYLYGTLYSFSGGLDPQVYHAGRTVLYNLASNLAGAICMNYYTQPTSGQWAAGFYGGPEYVLRYNTGGNIWFKMDASGACWMPGVYGDVASGGTTLYMASDGRIGTSTSVTAAKINIADIDGTSWLYNLRPVKFNFRAKNEVGEYTENPLTLKQYNGIQQQEFTVDGIATIFDINAQKEDIVEEVYINNVLAKEGIEEDYIALNGKLYWYGKNLGALIANDTIKIIYRDYIDTEVAPLEHGLLIEEAKLINSNLIGKDSNGNDRTIRDSMVLYALLKEVQNLNTRVIALENPT